MKIISFLKRVRRKVLTLAKSKGFLSEGLTRVPSVNESVISDLFVWRKSDEWKTFFELLNINNLVNADYQGSESDSATFVFYDEKGIEIGSEKRTVKQGRRTIDVGALLPKGYDGWGTYACFHDQISASVSEFGSFIAERGYSGYEWKNLGAKGYVHGNLDAIAKSNKGIEMLGTFWKDKHLYQLQHELTGPATYEFALVNPTNKQQNVEFITKDPKLDLKTLEKIKLAPRGSFIKTVEVHKGKTIQLVINSKMYMARPVVFRLQEYSMDVFHG